MCAAYSGSPSAIKRGWGGPGRVSHYCHARVSKPTNPVRPELISSDEKY